MNRLLIFLMCVTLISSCAALKNQDKKNATDSKSYAFEIQPTLKEVPIPTSNYYYTKSNCIDGVLTKDGNYLFTGLVIRGENHWTEDRPQKNIANPFVIKMNQNGEIKWKMVVDSIESRDQFRRVNRSGFASTAIREIDNYYALLSKDNTIAKIDNNGNLIKIITLDFQTTSMEVVDNNFVFAKPEENQISVIWTNQKGEITNSVQIKNDSIKRFFNRIFVDDKNNLYVFGSQYFGKSSLGEVHVYKISEEGSQIWKKEYSASEGNTGYLRIKDVSINNENIGITTDNEIFVIDTEGSIQYQYPRTKEEPRFAKGELTDDQKLVVLQYEYDPASLWYKSTPNDLMLLKSISPTGETEDLTGHFYPSDSLSQNGIVPRIVAPVLLNNQNDLILAGAEFTRGGDSDFQDRYIRKILINENVECPEIEVIIPPEQISYSEKKEIFKSQDWIEDSITFKNSGGAIQFLSLSDEAKNDIILMTENVTFPIFPGEEKTVHFKFNNRVSKLVFYIHSVTCPDPEESIRSQLFIPLIKRN